MRSARRQRPEGWAEHTTAQLRHTKSKARQRRCCQAQRSQLSRVWMKRIYLAKLLAEAEQVDQRSIIGSSTCSQWPGKLQHAGREVFSESSTWFCVAVGWASRSEALTRPCCTRHVLRFTRRSRSCMPWRCAELRGAELPSHAEPRLAKILLKKRQLSRLASVRRNRPGELPQQPLRHRID